MEKRTRVYPAERAGGGWLGKLMLFLSALILLSGLVFRDEPGDVTIRSVPTATPIPLDEPFDDTPAETLVTLPSASWFALQLGAFDDRAAAEATAEQYTRRGAGGFVWEDGKFRPLAAVYPTREDAQSVRTRLSQQHRVETYLYEITLPAIQLKLSGMKGQTEILEAAFIHASDLVSQLYALSSELDRQEIAVQECITRLETMAQTAQAVSLRLMQRFVSPRPAAVDGLMLIFDSFTAYALSRTGQESSAQMGADVKYHTLSTLYMLRHVYDTLSHT